MPKALAARSGTSAWKKKLYELNPSREEKQQVEVHAGKRKKEVYSVSPAVIEHGVRQNLCDKVSGTHTGIWLLLAEHLRLGTWDLLKKWTGQPDDALEPRIAMQMVHEAAVCSNRLRARGSLGHQGFEIANGLNFLVTDQQVHRLLKSHSVAEAHGHPG